MQRWTEALPVACSRPGCSELTAPACVQVPNRAVRHRGLFGLEGPLKLSDIYALSDQRQPPVRTDALTEPPPTTFMGAARDEARGLSAPRLGAVERRLRSSASSTARASATPPLTHQRRPVCDPPYVALVLC